MKENYSQSSKGERKYHLRYNSTQKTLLAYPIQRIYKI